MPIASGVAKQLRYKVEATFGTAPGAASAQLLRRVTSDLNLTKDTYQSGEIRPDYQIADFRHGSRRVAGSINGELSPKTYADFFAAALRRDFTTLAAITGLSITIATGAVIGGLQSYTLTRAAGDFIAGGLKVGHVIRLTAGSFNAANLNKNLLILTLTATVATVVPLNGVALFAEGPIASSTVSLPGRQTFAPTTGHTDRSFSIEHWFSDVPQSELYLGCKINKIDVALPPTGMGTVALEVMGSDVQTNASQYYTSPTAATSTGVMAAVNGIVCVQGVPAAILTGLNITIDGAYSGEPVVGSNKIPAVFPGRVNVNGQLSAYFDSATMRDYFINETEVSLVAVFSAGNGAQDDFVSFVLPRIKLGGAQRNDGEAGLVLTAPFQALFNSAGGAAVNSEQTTLLMQDSQA